MTDREINLRSILFLVIGILLLLSLVICIFIVGSEKDLVEVDAIVTNIEKNTEGTGRNDVTLLYDVDGIEYQYVYKTKDDLKVDDLVNIYYHSNNKTSVQAFKTSRLIFICPLIGLIICVIGLFELFKRNSHEYNIDYKTSVIGEVGDTRQLKIITDDAPVHQYEKTPEELAEAKVKVLKKDEPIETFVKEEIKLTSEVEKLRNIVKEQEEVLNIKAQEDTEKTIEIIEEEEEPIAIIERTLELDKIDEEDDNVETISSMEISTLKVDDEVENSMDKDEEPEDEENHNEEYDSGITDVEISQLTKQLFERVSKSEEPIEEDADKEEAVKKTVEVEQVEINYTKEMESEREDIINGYSETDILHSIAKSHMLEDNNNSLLEDIKEVKEQDNNEEIEMEEEIKTQLPIASSNNEVKENIVSKIHNVAKENTNIGEDEIKNMIKDVLKEVISENNVSIELDKKEVVPSQKRVLPNYFYISDNSLVYVEPGKDTDEVPFTEINSVIRTINSEGVVVKLVVSSDNVKCILTNMKNIDLEEVANSLNKKMKIIVDNFEEVIEYKEY